MSAARVGWGWRVAAAIGLGVGMVTAVAAIPDPDGPQWSAAAVQTAGVPVVHMSKTFLPTDPQPAPGEVLTYTVVLRNDTPYQATGYRIYGTIPTGFLDKRWDCTATGEGSVCGVENGVNNLDDVMDIGPNGGTIVYNVRGRVDPDLTEGFTQVVTLVAPPGQSCEPQYDPINNPGLVPILGPILPILEPHLRPTPTPSPDPTPDPTPDPGPAAGFAPAEPTVEPVPEQTGYGPQTPPPSSPPATSPPATSPPGAPEGAICVVNNDVVPRLAGSAPPVLPDTGPPVVVLGLIGVVSAAAGTSLLWWTGYGRRLRRILPGRSR